MTRVLIVDDHPAVRAGLVNLIGREPGFTVVASCETATEALAESRRWRPDVALLDYELPDGDGLAVSYELHAQLPAPPNVAIYSAFPEPQLSLAAALAGAQAVIDKSQPVEAVFETLRAVARGAMFVDRADPALRAAATMLDPADHPVVGMALAGEPVSEIASVLGQREDEIAVQLQSIIERLRPVRSEGSRFR